ncbi:MAG: hypothetical protein OEP48_13545 [Betaproteobacteria bacterium]|nr:hypothetical protein [Betaproteobacteria bacterium]MDH3438087.1 hypothetical protein [Betaproteobacteria bacterium]
MIGSKQLTIARALMVVGVVVASTSVSAQSGLWLTCNGKPATIYVLNGKIVGGPDDGQPYTGTLRGTDGNDVIVGTSSDDQIFGGGGDDMICAGPGEDVVEGGPGNDYIEGGPGDDQLRGGPGGDTIQGGPGDDDISAD